MSVHNCSAIGIVVSDFRKGESKMKCWDMLVGDGDQIIAQCNRDENHSGLHASGPWNWEQTPCPHCGAAEPKIEGGSTPGFTGAAIYWVDYLCCGAQDFDASADNEEAAR